MKKLSIILLVILIVSLTKNIFAEQLLENFTDKKGNTISVKLIDQEEIDLNLSEQRTIYNNAFWEARVQSGLAKGNDVEAKLKFFECISSSMDEVKKLMLESADQVFGLSAKKEGTIVGFIIFSKEKDPGTIYINQCAISPDFWNCGIATGLLKSIKQVVSDTNKIVFMARKKNKIATQLYEYVKKHGVKATSYVHEGMNPEVYQGYELCVTESSETLEKMKKEHVIKAASLVKNVFSISGDVTVHELKGGLSGACLFGVNSGSKEYVVRFLKNKNLDEQKQEIALLQIASKAGYGPHVYFADADQGVVIMEFLSNQNISVQLQQSHLLYELLAKILQEIHLGPKFEDIQNKDIFDVINKKISAIKSDYNEEVPLIKIENILEAVHQALISHLSIVPCHNDLDPSNLIFLGDKFKAIDFETAFMGDPYFDIATIAVFYCENNVSEHVLLSKYLKQQPSKIDMAKLYLMKHVYWIYTVSCFLKMTPEQLHKYAELNVPSYIDFLKEWFEGKINLENPENKLKFAKVMINHVITNYESQEFGDAVKLLTA